MANENRLATLQVRSVYHTWRYMPLFTLDEPRKKVPPRPKPPMLLGPLKRMETSLEIPSKISCFNAERNFSKEQAPGVPGGLRILATNEHFDNLVRGLVERDINSFGRLWLWSLTDSRSDASLLAEVGGNMEKGLKRLGIHFCHLYHGLKRAPQLGCQFSYPLVPRLDDEKRIIGYEQHLVMASCINPKRGPSGWVMEGFPLNSAERPNLERNYKIIAH